MKKLLSFILLIIVLIIAGEGVTSAQTNKRKTRSIEKSIAGNKRKSPKTTKVKEPRAVQKAKNEAAKREDKREKEYEKAVRNNKNRHYRIQSEEVKARMKQNEKDIKTRDKARSKEKRRKSRSVKKKYKK